MNATGVMLTSPHEDSRKTRGYRLGTASTAALKPTLEAALRPGS